jgi:leader peptidase (prepilin peptidase) / N-methyltransferase
MQSYKCIVVFLSGIVIGGFLNAYMIRSQILREHSNGYESRQSLQYPLIEILNGIFYVIIIHRVGINPNGILLCLLCSILLVLSFIDFKTYYIPVEINICVLFIGLLYTFFDYKKVGDHLLGMSLVSGFLFVIYLVTKKKGIGDGDIKLMVGAGAFLGFWPSVLALWIACLLGAVIHSIRMKITKVGHQLAFGPYLAVGILFSSLYGEELMLRYMEYLLR